MLEFEILVFAWVNLIKGRKNTALGALFLAPLFFGEERELFFSKSDGTRFRFVPSYCGIVTIYFCLLHSRFRRLVVLLCALL